MESTRITRRRMLSQSAPAALALPVVLPLGNTPAPRPIFSEAPDAELEALARRFVEARLREERAFWYAEDVAEASKITNGGRIDYDLYCRAEEEVKDPASRAVVRIEDAIGRALDARGLVAVAAAGVLFLRVDPEDDGIWQSPRVFLPPDEDEAAGPADDGGDVRLPPEAPPWPVGVADEELTRLARELAEIRARRRAIFARIDALDVDEDHDEIVRLEEEEGPLCRQEGRREDALHRAMTARGVAAIVVDRQLYAIADNDHRDLDWPVIPLPDPDGRPCNRRHDPDDAA